jgi:hypothetical protein
MHERPASAVTSLALRLRVYLRRINLDRQIAAGRPCASSAELAMRACQLTERRTLWQLAGGLRRVVAYVDRAGAGPVFTAVVIDRAAVAASRHAILGLAERLEGAAPVSPRGVALVLTLLSDGLSPLFDRHCERTVVQAIWEVQDALEVMPPAESLTQHPR